MPNGSVELWSLEDRERREGEGHQEVSHTWYKKWSKPPFYSEYSGCSYDYLVYVTKN